MRLCIPTHDESGLKAELHGHFGRAEFYTIVDTEAKTIEVLPNRGASGGQGHGHGHGHGCGNLNRPGFPEFDAIVCRGMGRRALANLLAEGHAVYATERTTVQEAVLGMETGELTALSDPDACGGREAHGEGGCHQHEHRHEHGRNRER